MQQDLRMAMQPKPHKYPFYLFVSYYLHLTTNADIPGVELMVHAIAQS